MAIEVPFIPPPVENPVVKARHRTLDLHVFTPKTGEYSIAVIREIQYLDANEIEVDAPPGAKTGYGFNLAITPELMAAHPEVGVLISGISAFIDATDPKLKA